MTHRIVTGIACVIISAGTVSFPSYLQEKLAQYEGPMDEIQVTYKKPMTTMQMLISNCPNNFGALDVFMECREDVIKRFNHEGLTVGKK